MSVIKQSEETKGTSSFERNSIQSISNIWVQKYQQKLVTLEKTETIPPQAERIVQAQKLYQSLHSTNSLAWNQTQRLLSNTSLFREIDTKLIRSEEISHDVYNVYEKILLAYADRVIPRHLAVSTASALSRIRRKYTAKDPRVMGCVSMQFHYSGKLLLQSLSQPEQTCLTPYIQVIDEHLYLPWQRLYSAAANYEYDAPVLELARQLLSASPKIAHGIYEKLLHLCSSYRFYSRLLKNSMVSISEVRDIETFQMYLLVCVLEKSIRPVQEELIPICTMLYPAWKVNWELIRQMLCLLCKEMQKYLTPEQVEYFTPYFQQLWGFLSPENFPNPEKFPKTA